MASTLISSSSYSLNPILPRKTYHHHHQASKNTFPKRYYHASRLSCKAKHNHDDQENSPKTNPNYNHEDLIPPPYILGHRRDVLLGLGSLGAAATLGTGNPLALAAPIQPPDINDCGPPDLPSGATPTNCCPPRPSGIIDFKLPSIQLPLRVRPAAQDVTNEYIKKYKRAVQLMKALPSDDPRSFVQQANVHCAYCDGAYHQVGFPDLDLQVHNSWLFFPFHRWYLYFHERILGSLIGDPTFALPFWNWDSQPGMQIPQLYADKTSSVYDPLRDSTHQPPTLIDLDFNLDSTTNDASVSANYAIMYRQMVSNSKTPRYVIIYLNGQSRFDKFR